MDRVLRILVANQPRLMRELLLDTLSDQPGIEIVGEVADQAEIPALIKQSSPDLVVITLDDPGKRPSICDEILRENPKLRILAVAWHENRTFCYWASFDIHSDEVETSPAGILDAVKHMALARGVAE